MAREDSEADTHDEDPPLPESPLVDSFKAKWTNKSDYFSSGGKVELNWRTYLLLQDIGKAARDLAADRGRKKVVLKDVLDVFDRLEILLKRVNLKPRDDED